MPIAILYRDKSGRLRAVAELSRRNFRTVAVHEFPDYDEAMRWAARRMAEDANWQLIELKEL
jgi:hypothetical protein